MRIEFFLFATALHYEIQDKLAKASDLCAMNIRGFQVCRFISDS